MFSSSSVDCVRPSRGYYDKMYAHNNVGPRWWSKKETEIIQWPLHSWCCMSILKHSMLSGEPRDCSIDIQTEKVVNIGVMFLPELA
jgi:hypothetical protein